MLKRLIFPVLALIMITCFAMPAKAQYAYVNYNGKEYEISDFIETYGDNMNLVRSLCEEYIDSFGQPQKVCMKSYTSKARGERLTHTTARAKKYEALKYLIEKWGIPYDNFRENPNNADIIEDYTQLMVSADNLDKRIVDYLLSKGASASKRNGKEWGSRNAYDFALNSKQSSPDRAYVIASLKKAAGIAMNEINKRLQQRTIEIRNYAQSVPGNKELLLRELKNPQVIHNFNNLTAYNDYLSASAGRKLI